MQANKQTTNQSASQPAGHAPAGRPAGQPSQAKPAGTAQNRMETKPNQAKPNPTQPSKQAIKQANKQADDKDRVEFVLLREEQSPGLETDLCPAIHQGFAVAQRQTDWEVMVVWVHYQNSPAQNKLSQMASQPHSMVKLPLNLPMSVEVEHLSGAEFK